MTHATHRPGTYCAEGMPELCAPNCLCACHQESLVQALVACDRCKRGYPPGDLVQPQTHVVGIEGLVCRECAQEMER